MNLKFKYNKAEKQTELEQFAADHLNKYHRFLVHSSKWTFHFSVVSVKNKRDQELQLVQKSGFATQRKITGASKFKVMVEAQTSWGYFKAEAHGGNFEEGIEQACLKIEKQILKIKSQLQNHKKYAKSKSGQLKLITPELEYQPSRIKKSA